MVQAEKEKRSRARRDDVRRAVIDFLKERESWCSTREVYDYLVRQGIKPPEQLATVLRNMAVAGWLKWDKVGWERRYYLADWQKPEEVA